MSNPIALSLVDLTAQLAARKLSPVELMRSVFARIDATNDKLNAVVAMHDREKLLGQGLEPIGGTPEQFGAYIKSEIAKWAKVVKASGARPE